jgi:hypothetical protein
MEEFWKHYTRPSILTGKYPLPTHCWLTPIYLTSVHDMGRLAGLAIETKGEFLLGDNLKLHQKPTIGENLLSPGGTLQLLGLDFFDATIGDYYLPATGLK